MANKIIDLIMEGGISLIMITVVYVLVTLFQTTIASALSITLPTYFTGLATIVYIMLFFAIVIFTIMASMNVARHSQ